MNRIKQHYQEFLIDDGKCEEWYKELKDYNTHEVNDKLEEHLKSEQFGNQIPKIGFLTKYLIKEKEKPQFNITKIKLKCGICGKTILYDDFDKHMERCNSVEYLNFQSQRLYDKEIDKEKYRNLNDEEFNKVYNKVLNKILEITTDKEEQERISNYFLGS